MKRRAALVVLALAALAAIAPLVAGYARARPVSAHPEWLRTSGGTRVKVASNYAITKRSAWEIDQDLDWLQARGFHGIRVFAGSWRIRKDGEIVGEVRDSIVRTADGAIASEQLPAIAHLVRSLRARGMFAIVCVNGNGWLYHDRASTLPKDPEPIPRVMDRASEASLVAAARNVAQLFARDPDVIAIDGWNEIGGQDTRLVALVLKTVRANAPHSWITASSDGPFDLQVADLTRLAQAGVALNFIDSHDSRGSDWVDEAWTYAWGWRTTLDAYGFRDVPVGLIEPMRPYWQREVTPQQAAQHARNAWAGGAVILAAHTLQGIKNEPIRWANDLERAWIEAVGRS